MAKPNLIIEAQISQCGETRLAVGKEGDFYFFPFDSLREGYDFVDEILEKEGQQLLNSKAN